MSTIIRGTSRLASEDTETTQPNPHPQPHVSAWQQPDGLHVSPGPGAPPIRRRRARNGRHRLRRKCDVLEARVSKIITLV